MKRSIYQQKNINKEKRKAIALYRQGFTFREVGSLLNPPKSYQWVKDTWDEYEKQKKQPKLPIVDNSLDKI